jgi:cell division protein FtsQ
MPVNRRTQPGGRTPRGAAIEREEAPRGPRGYLGRTEEAREADRTQQIRSRKRLMAAAVSLVLASAIAGLLLGVLGSPMFQVRDVQVQSADESLATEAAQVAKAISFGTIWLPPMREIEGRIGRLPRARAVRVDRALPSTLTIVVEPREPVAVVHQEERLMVVDADGVCLHWTGSAPEGMPRVRVEEPSALAVGGKLRASDVEMMNAVRAGLEQTALLEEARIDLSRPVRVEVLTAGGVLGKLGNEELLEEKALLFGKLLHSLEERGEPLLYIDLRVPSRPTFKRVD